MPGLGDQDTCDGWRSTVGSTHAFETLGLGAFAELDLHVVEGLAIGGGEGLSTVSEDLELSEGEAYALVIIVEVNTLVDVLFVDHTLVTKQLSTEAVNIL